MEREQESVGNKHGESKAEEQSRLAQIALERAQGSLPAVGSSFTQTTDAEASGLSWAGGPPVAPGGMGSEVERVASVSSPVGAPALGRDAMPSLASASPAGRFTSSPLAVESGTGRALSGIDQILGYHDHGRR